MRELLQAVRGARLPLKDYQADFQQHFWRIGAAGFWKLERQQTFAEPRSPSWQAFARGAWDEAMHRLEDQRPDIADYYRRIAEAGFRTKRVRVLAEPLTPYLRWELQLLRLRSEYGAGMRVVREDQVERFEESGPLPEVCTLGDEVMYEVRYDTDGALAGGIRYRDPELIARCRGFIRDLYDRGEELAAFADRSGLVPGVR